METATVPSGLAPDQEDRRNEIVAAAAYVVAEEGLASCTVRRIAGATPFTRNTIHANFEDTDDLTGETITPADLTGATRAAGPAAQEGRPGGR